MDLVLQYIFKYPIEILLLCLAIIITVSIVIIFPTKSSIVSAESINSKPQIENNDKKQQYTVDIEGSVVKPNVYKVPADSTIHSVIEIAGGLSSDADREFIGRNMNMAENITDKQKIYIPSKTEIENGLYSNNSPTKNEELRTESNAENTEGISINNASLEELDTLPGIGPTTAQKIIDNRPYSSVDELLDKKVTSVSTFGKIKDLVQL